MAQLSWFLLGILACKSIVFCQTGSNIPLTNAQKMEIVKLHNDYRRSKYSSNMRYMTWDGELAWMAESYGKLCRYRHNKNRKHSKYSSVGENIYASTVKSEDFRVAMPMRKWYSENSNFFYYSSTCRKGKVCGHYTQIVWADSFKVGCALTECKFISEVKYRNAPLFICVYATADRPMCQVEFSQGHNVSEGNVVEGPNRRLQAVYERGYPCSKCSDAEDYCRGRLCANSKRDFIEPPDDPQVASETTLTGYIAALAVLSVVVVALIAWIIFKEVCGRRITARCYGKERLKRVSRSNTYGTSMTPSLSFTKASNADGDNSIPLISQKSSQLNVTTEVSARNVTTLVTEVTRRPASLNIKSEAQLKKGSRTSFPKPTHPAPRSPPPRTPAPVLVRP